MAKADTTAAATSRQRAFAEFIAQGKSQQEAYRLAGYKCRSASSVATAACRLAKNVQVREMIVEAREKASSDRIANAQEIQELFTDIARAAITTTRITDEGKPIECDPEFKDRLKAAELLGKIKGLFVEKSKVEGRLEIVIRRGADAPSAINRKE